MIGNNTLTRSPKFSITSNEPGSHLDSINNLLHNTMLNNLKLVRKVNIIYGSPGSGKSLLADFIARYYANVQHAEQHEINNASYFFNDLKKDTGLLIIDNLDLNQITPQFLHPFLGDEIVVNPRGEFPFKMPTPDILLVVDATHVIEHVAHMDYHIIKRLGIINTASIPQIKKSY